jgi:hypothetical protein
MSSWSLVALTRTEYIAMDTSHQKLNVERKGHFIGLMYSGIIYDSFKSPKDGASAKLKLFVFLNLARHVAEHLYHEMAIAAHDGGFADKLPFLAITEVTGENGLFNTLQLVSIPVIFGFTMFGFSRFFQVFPSPF